MGDIGFRRKGDNTPLYNPERDYAYITPTLMAAAVESLEANDTPERKYWRDTNNITDAELVKVAEGLALAQRDFVNAVDPVNNFAQALNRHGFYDIRYVVRNYLFATIGEVFCAAWFKAVREVSIVGEPSPAHTDMARFAAAVREFANQHKSALYDANHMAEHLRMMNDVLASREQTLLAVLHKKEQELLAVKKDLATMTAPKAAKHETGFFARLLRYFKGR